MTYSHEIIGGVLIGLASVAPLVLEGRVAGISGYAASSARPTSRESKAALLLVLGLVAGGFLGPYISLPLPPLPQGSTWVWGIAGVLVGFGSRLAGGCTSGHGVCGLGRLSKRSLVAVLIFMSFAIITRLIYEALS